MRWLNGILCFIAIVMVILVIAGCSGGDEKALLQVAYGEIKWWRWFAIIGIGVAFLIGIALGSKARQ